VSAAWQLLFDEIARCADSGRAAEFWWRDDDAAQPSAALSRLLTLSESTATPLALAVIPLQVDEEIFRNLGRRIAVLQHGADHINRAGPGEKKTEFAASEPPAEALARLAAGRRRLQVRAGAHFLPVLAPPWNRLPDGLAALLGAAGFTGVSQFGARRLAEAARGVRQVNTHVDVVAWRAGRGFVGVDEALAAAVGHLTAKRLGEADPWEATGWLTHHAVHDAAAWAFLERLFESTRDLPGVAWRRPEEIFKKL